MCRSLQLVGLLLLAGALEAWSPGRAVGTAGQRRWVPVRRAGGDGDDVVDESVAQVDRDPAPWQKVMDLGPQSSSFTLVYTCNRCDTRNMNLVQRKSWESGVVISTCQGCQHKHLLADATGLLDRTNITGFSNVANQLRERGETVQELATDSDDALQQLEALGIRLDDGGNFTLVPRDGDENIVTREMNERVQAVGPHVDEAMKRVPINTSHLFAPFDPQAAAVPPEARVAPCVSTRSLFEAGSVFTIGMPEGPEPGDMLNLETHIGTMLLPVPDGADPGCGLQVQGAVSFELSETVREGEVIELAADDGTTFVVSAPEDVPGGSSLMIADPVYVIPADRMAERA